MLWLVFLQFSYCFSSEPTFRQNRAGDFSAGFICYVKSFNKAHSVVRKATDNCLNLAKTEEQKAACFEAVFDNDIWF